MEIGNRIIHKEYGNGTIIEDKEKLCHKDEVFVKFDDALPFKKLMGGPYAGFLYHEYSDIVKIEDLELL